MEHIASQLEAVADALETVAPTISIHRLEPPGLRGTDVAQETSGHQITASRTDPRATHREEQRISRRGMRQNGADFYTDRLKERRQEAKAKRRSGRQLASQELAGSQKRGRSFDAQKLLTQMADMSSDECKAQMMQVLGGMKPKKAKNTMSPATMRGGHSQPAHSSHMCITNTVPEHTTVESIRDFSQEQGAPATRKNLLCLL